MKKFFVFLLFICLFSFNFATFVVRDVDVTFHVYRDYVEARQSIDIYIEGTEDISRYTNLLSNSTLDQWIALIGEEVRLYVDRRYVVVEDLQVRPQPLRNYDPVGKKANGKILITYKVFPYKNKPDTGLFKVEMLKPRVYVYKLNPDALAFKRNDRGEIIIDEKTTLKFVLPEGSEIIDINPRPLNLKEDMLDFPLYVNEVYWHNTILPGFSLKFIVRQGLDEEIIEFFNKGFDSIVDFAFSDDGRIIIPLVLVVIVFYVALINKIKVVGDVSEE